MKQVIERLRSIPGILIVEREQAWKIEIRKQDFICEVTVPQEILEWFAEVKNHTGLLWQDWVDYYSIKGETREMLASDMASDIEIFVTALVKSDLRVLENRSEKRNSLILQCKVEESWKPISLNLS